ncbi:MAG: hypothetical protein AMXMBFR7_48710 [Planctomycetota bacterium]
MSKQAQPSYPIHELLAKRWSPYWYDERPVKTEDLRSIFEAARWAASSYNEQPWRFIVGTKDQPEQYAKVLSVLIEANQAWAQRAPVLALGVIGRSFERNGKPNKAAEHDLGLAAASLTVEATARGLHVHQMIGLDPEKGRSVFGVPAGFEVFTALAIGYAADPAQAPEALRGRDTAPRGRKPLSEIVFGGTWGQASSAVK